MDLKENIISLSSYNKMFDCNQFGIYIRYILNLISNNNHANELLHWSITFSYCDGKITIAK